MVPARNLLRDAHGRGASTGIDDAVAALPTLQAAPVSAMAQEPFNEQQEPTKQPPPQQERQEVQEEQREAGLRLQQEVGTSGNGSGGHKDWLRLGLGPSSHSGGGGSAELELFTEHAPPPQPLQMPGAPFLRPAVAGIPPAPMPLLPVPRAGPPWLPPWHTPAAAQPPPPMLQLAPRGIFGPGAGTAGFEMIRVVLPPAAAAAAGIWFALQAAQNQGREPFLPQIPRSYLRIKDGRVTIRLLIKYLVNKLGLEDESEVEITCRGRPLLPFLTLQHVRDSIWCQRDAMSPSVPPDMSTANHIMVLQYGRRL